MTYQEALDILQRRSYGIKALGVAAPKTAEAIDIAVSILKKEVEKQREAEDAEFTEIE